MLRELKADFVAADRALDAGDFLECDESGPCRGGEPLQASGHENAVLGDERHEVGDGAERDEIEQRAQIKFLRAGEVGGATVLEQRVCELEGQAGGAEFGEAN